MASPDISRQPPASSDWNSTVDSISQILDEKIYYPLYSEQAGQWELSFSGLAQLSKLTKKLTNVKVGTALLGLFVGLSSIRYFSSSDLRCIFYAVAALDLFRISYNSFGRKYLSIVAKQSTTLQIGESIMSLFTGKSKNDVLLRQLTEEINWSYLLTGTITLSFYKKGLVDGVGVLCPVVVWCNLLKVDDN